MGELEVQATPAAEATPAEEADAAPEEAAAAEAVPEDSAWSWSTWFEKDNKVSPWLLFDLMGYFTADFDINFIIRNLI